MQTEEKLTIYIMNSKFILTSVLFATTIMFAQVPFPHIATTNSNVERVASFGVSDVSTDLLEITNSTVNANSFIPTIWAHQQSDNRFVMRHFATTNSTQDNGTNPIMIFRAELRNSLNLTAPNEIYYPWGSTASNVSVRPLFAWENGNTQLMRIAANGNITIGTVLNTVGYKLAVGGKIIAEELKVQLQAQWPDYVFGKEYKLPTLAEVEKQIQEKGHLANVPSACEIEIDGLEVGNMMRIQQQKIEELTLYIIELNKKLQTLESKINN